MTVSCLPTLLVVAAFCVLCGGDRSSDDNNVQITLGGGAHMQMQSHHKVRHASEEENTTAVSHPEVLNSSTPTHDDQAFVGVTVAVVIMLINIMLAIVMYRADLAPASQLWGSMLSTAETTVGIMKNLIGAGILCLPIAASEMSIVGAMVGMIFCGLCSLASFLLIGFACHRLNASSYGELMAAAFGNKYGKARVSACMNVLLLLHTLGGCIAYMTIIADISAKLAQDCFHMPEFLLRGMCLLLITLFLLLPLCLYDRLKSLSMASYLGVTAMVFVAGFCVRDCIADWATVGSTTLVTDHMVSFKRSFFKAVPLINGAFMVHYNAPTFFAEVEGRSLYAYGIAATLAHIGVSLIYLAVGFAGFARFGEEVHGNVLTSYEASGHSWVITCWVCVLLNMVLTVPLLFQRSRQSLMVILEPHWTGTHNCFYYVTGILLLFIVICGTFLRHLDAIMMVREATIGVLLMYILPGAVCIQVLRRSAETVRHSNDHLIAVPLDRAEAPAKLAAQTKDQGELEVLVGEGDAKGYRHVLCMCLLLAGVGSSTCAALATVVGPSV